MLGKKIFLFVLVLLGFFQLGQAGPSDRLSGYAWSDGAGWISFNCTNTGTCDTVDYGVTVDNNGNLTGYAWSDNLGWLWFNHNITGVEAAKFDVNTGEMSGFAVFLAARDSNDIGNTASNTGGWNGLVSLGDNDPNDSISYGVSLDSTNYQFKNYAWGDTNVGWISFNCSNQNQCGTSDYKVSYDPFYFFFSTQGGLGLTETNKVNYNGDVTLIWQTDADNCNASGDWMGTKGAGNPTQDSETINSLTSDKNYTLTCSKDGVETSKTLNVLVKGPPPSLNLTVDDDNVSSGSNVNLSWTGENVENCRADSNPTGLWSGGKSSTGSDSVGPLILSENIFTLTCNPTSTDYSTINSSVAVYVERPTVELRAAKTMVPYGDNIELYYTLEFVNNCSTDTATSTDQVVVPGWASENVDSNIDGTEKKFTSTDMAEEGKIYKADLACDPVNGGDRIEKNVIINSRKNPTYIEI